MCDREVMTRQQQPAVSRLLLITSLLCSFAIVRLSGGLFVTVSYLIILIEDVNKDLSPKAKARTKNHNIVLKDNVPDLNYPHT